MKKTALIISVLILILAGCKQKEPEINSILNMFDRAGLEVPYLHQKYGDCYTFQIGLSPKEDPEAANIVRITEIIAQNGYKLRVYETGNKIGAAVYIEIRRRGLNFF